MVYSVSCWLLYFMNWVIETINKMKFYKVGGSVRDDIMRQMGKNVPVSHDIDYAVEASSYESMRDYISGNGRIYQERPEFYTIRAKMPEYGDCDFVLCRKEEGYSDGRHPDFVTPGTIYDDLSRRDFTMNAIAIDEKGQIYDPYDGQGAIRDNTIRCVGVTKNRMEEDGLRMLRAIRFAVTKDMIINGPINSFLLNVDNFSLLNSVSVDRIREEMNKMFEVSTYESFVLMKRYHELFEWIFTLGIRLEASQKGMTE